MFSLTNKNIFENFNTLNAGAYEINVYLDKKSGPGILFVEIFIDGVKINSEKFVCQNTNCFKKSISINEKSKIKVKIKSQYSGVTIIKRVDYKLLENKKILKNKKIAFIINNNEDLYKIFNKLINSSLGYCDISLFNLEPNKIEQTITNESIVNFHCYNLLNLDNYILNYEYDVIFIHDSKNLDLFFEKINFSNNLILISNKNNYSSQFVKNVINYNNNLIFKDKEYIYEDFYKLINEFCRSTRIPLRNPYPNEIIKEGELV